MTSAEYPEFVRIITALAELYNQKQPSEFVLALWWNALKDYDLLVVRQALSAHVKNPDSGMFMPKPADVEKMVGGSSSDKALIAWSRVAEAVRRVGSWESVVFDDAIIHAVIHDMGGWVVVSMKDDSEWDFVRNEFINRYRGYAYRNETPKYPPVLVGMFEAHNTSHGFRSNPPRLVGNPERARQVMAGGADTVLEISPASTFMRLSA